MTPLEHLEALAAAQANSTGFVLPNFAAIAQQVRKMQAVCEAAKAWRDNTKHGRDICDEGYSVPREEDEIALIAALAALEGASNEQ